MSTLSTISTTVKLDTPSGKVEVDCTRDSEFGLWSASTSLSSDVNIFDHVPARDPEAAMRSLARVLREAGDALTKALDEHFKGQTQR